MAITLFILMKVMPHYSNTICICGTTKQGKDEWRAMKTAPEEFWAYEVLGDKRIFLMKDHAAVEET